MENKQWMALSHIMPYSCNNLGLKVGLDKSKKLESAPESIKCTKSCVLYVVLCTVTNKLYECFHTHKAALHYLLIFPGLMRTLSL